MHSSNLQLAHTLRHSLFNSVDTQLHLQDKNQLRHIKLLVFLQVPMKKKKITLSQEFKCTSLQTDALSPQIFVLFPKDFQVAYSFTAYAIPHGSVLGKVNRSISKPN